jgi:hypothetical protein
MNVSDPVSNPKRTADEHADIMCPSAIPFVLVHLACLGHSGPGSRGTCRNLRGALLAAHLCDRRRIPSILLAWLPPSLNGFALRPDDCSQGRAALWLRWKKLCRSSHRGKASSRKLDTSQTNAPSGEGTHAIPAIAMVNENIAVAVDPKRSI